MMNVKCGTFLLFIGLMVLLAASAVSYGAPAAQRTQGSLHATTSLAMHQAVRSQADQAAHARRFVVGLLDKQDIALQAKIAGYDAARLKARVSALSDSEILILRRQLMPRVEQNVPAGMEEKYLIPILAGVSAGLAVGMFMFAY